MQIILENIENRKICNAVLTYGEACNYFHSNKHGPMNIFTNSKNCHLNYDFVTDISTKAQKVSKLIEQFSPFDK